MGTQTTVNRTTTLIQLWESQLRKVIQLVILIQIWENQWPKITIRYPQVNQSMIITMQTMGFSMSIMSQTSLLTILTIMMVNVNRPLTVKQDLILNGIIILLTKKRQINIMATHITRQPQDIQVILILAPKQQGKSALSLLVLLH